VSDLLGARADDKHMRRGLQLPPSRWTRASRSSAGRRDDVRAWRVRPPPGPLGITAVRLPLHLTWPRLQVSFGFGGTRMKIASWNVNGMRAVVRKAFRVARAREPRSSLLAGNQVHEGQLGEGDYARLADLGYETYWHCAERKGYSGVATFARRAPLFVTTACRSRTQRPGARQRARRLHTLQRLTSPNGPPARRRPRSGRLRFKLSSMRTFCTRRRRSAQREGPHHQRRSGTPRSRDHIARPKETRTSTGFTPIEREALQRWIDHG